MDILQITGVSLIGLPMLLVGFATCFFAIKIIKRSTAAVATLAIGVVTIVVGTAMAGEGSIRGVTEVIYMLGIGAILILGVGAAVFVGAFLANRIIAKAPYVMLGAMLMLGGAVVAGVAGAIAGLLIGIFAGVMMLASQRRKTTT